VETNHNPLFVSEFTVFLLYRCFLTPIVLLSTCGIQNCSENQVYYIRLFDTVPKVLLALCQLRREKEKPVEWRLSFSRRSRFRVQLCICATYFGGVTSNLCTHRMQRSKSKPATDEQR
jgi:hypothetical protein